MDRYEEDHWIRDWFDANEEMILLHDALCCRQIFRLIQEKDEILSEARTFPEQNSLFPEEDLELGERDREGLAAIGAYKDYLEYPEDYGGEDHIVYQLAMSIILVCSSNADTAGVTGKDEGAVGCLWAAEREVGRL